MLSPSPKPKLRGLFHLIASFAAIAALARIVDHAAPGKPRLSALFYGSALVLLFSISALYHVPHWAPARRQVLRKLDHSAIYLMIWGTMAPISWVAAPPSLGTWTFGLMTLGAAAGIAKTIRWPNLPKRVSALIYVLFACLLLPTVPSVAEKSGAWGAVLLLFGGVLFAIGALIYSKRSPNPIPGVLGYHEVFHLLVIAAAACQYVTVWRILDP